MSGLIAAAFSPAGKVVMAALIAAVALIWVYQEGKASGRAGLAIRVAEAVEAERQRQAAEIDAVLDAAGRRQTVSAAALQQANERIDAYEAELAARPAAACMLDDAAADRIR